MVHFLSINFFFLDFFNFCWVFQKFPFFFVSLCIFSRFASSYSGNVTVVYVTIAFSNIYCSKIM